MKRSTVLKISLLLLAFGFLASCKSSSSSSFAPIYRSPVSEHCSSVNQRAPSKGVKFQEAPPSKVTPIGGNFSIRN